MLFSSLSFLYFFLPLTILAYFALRSRRWRNGVLLVCSLIFYSWGEPKYLLLMISSALLAYLCGLGIDKCQERVHKKSLLALAVTILIGSLFVFKYLNFLSDTVLKLTGMALISRNIALPIGISFYTFQILSYLIDLYRGHVKVQKSFFRFTLYVSFFPQLIAGPIVRYETVENEISDRSESGTNIVEGGKRFIIGLAKKVLLANQVALVAQRIYNSGAGAGTAALWLAALCYTLQIYFDFSGYSDMAIGLGRIFGFHFLENFNYPYFACSITDFWRRWHISLSSWFRDYVYIPLGGSRAGTGRTLLNILIVWCLTGMWHGAAWNFILWGLYYAVLLIAEKLVFGKRLERSPSFVRHVYTLFFVIIGWVIFCITDISQLGTVLKGMFVYTPTDWIGLLNQDISISFNLLFIVPAAVLSFPVLKKRIREQSLLALTIDNGAYVALLGVSIMFIISSSYNPFIYFRF